jgi:hypothetical protein
MFWSTGVDEESKHFVITVVLISFTVFFFGFSICDTSLKLTIKWEGNQNSRKIKLGD